MDTGSEDQNLHPNLARIAAAYDNIIEQIDAGRLTPAQARSMISLLEARDDQGIRWSIDPDTGEFVRKTAFGDLEYDTPPTQGVLTHDPYTLSGGGQDPNDPNARMHVTEVPAALQAPSALAGATSQAAPQFSNPVGALRRRPTSRVSQVLIIVAVIALTAAAALFVFTQFASSGTPTPQPTKSSSVDPSGKDDEGGKNNNKKTKKPAANTPSS